MTIIAKHTILIAEDNYANYFLLQEMLKSREYNILRAKDGREAVEMVKENPNIVIVLMDINMPILDGLKATTKIKKIRPDMPVIAQTAFYSTSRKKEFKDAGLDECVTKPIDINDLFSKIDTFVN